MYNHLYNQSFYILIWDCMQSSAKPTADNRVTVLHSLQSFRHSVSCMAATQKH